MPKHRKLQKLAKTGSSEPLEARCTLDFQEPTFGSVEPPPAPTKAFSPLSSIGPNRNRFFLGF